MTANTNVTSQRKARQGGSGGVSRSNPNTTRYQYLIYCHISQRSTGPAFVVRVFSITFGLFGRP